ncbi:MAG: hypothetical protein NPIRA01_14460 [Nitrospirales bacterium]|nr:MAG: hypothetical protein NPIRA01_14460 [Nitrospirales bacterium]
MTCICQQHYDEAHPIRDSFATVRQNCPALREVLLPDTAWQLASKRMDELSDPSKHRSYLLLAYEHGVLAKITAPIHRFLLIDAHPHNNFTKQYRKDLQERWIIESDPTKRHERYRRFFGKLVELLVCQTLTEREWTVTGLEALGACADIIAVSPENMANSLSVKYIGQSTYDFEQNLSTLVGGPTIGVGSPYDAINYLLFRIYEAAYQLQNFSTPKIAIIVIDAMTWHVFEEPLESQWVCWTQPAFCRGSCNWDNFLQKQYGRYPTIRRDLSDIVRTLNRIFVFEMNSQYEFVLKHDEQLGV